MGSDEYGSSDELWPNWRFRVIENFTEPENGKQPQTYRDDLHASLD